MKQFQKEIYQNKLNHGFNVTDVGYEFLLLYGEVSEAYEAWLKKHDDFGEELADVAIYLMGIAEICGIDLEEQVRAKIEKNKKRKYGMIDGVPQKIEE